MNKDNTYHKGIIPFVATAFLAVTAATAQVTIGTTGIDAPESFQQEVHACMTGRTQQTCLTEARKAQADKKRGLLDKSPDIQTNAMARCDVFTEADENAECQARVMNMGSTQGSIAGGGIIREVETVVFPADQSSITFEPKTADPVVIVPVK